MEDQKCTPLTQYMVGLDLNTFGNPCLRLIVAKAELFILGFRPAMLHIFI